MTTVEVIGWKATGFSAHRHYWKSRPHTDLAVSRCGQVVHKKFLVEKPWLTKCPYCEVLLGSENNDRTK